MSFPAVGDDEILLSGVETYQFLSHAILISVFLSLLTVKSPEAQVG